LLSMLEWKFYCCLYFELAVEHCFAFSSIWHLLASSIDRLHEQN
jgi:hypothetical protein